MLHIVEVTVVSCLIAWSMAAADRAIAAGATSAGAAVAGATTARASIVTEATTMTDAPATAGADSSQSEIESFKRAIRKLYDLKEKAWAAGDAESIVTKFYSPDAISVGEGDPNTMVGRDQFRAAYRQYVKDVPSIRIESVRTYVNGNAGWDWANFYSYPKPDKKSLYPPSPIRILFTWAKENGRWVCKGDIFVNGKFPKLP
jgi:uncharacterized protein (TIGR02246 family)